MNPAVDRATSVDALLSERKLRCDPPTTEPGGGGINVSRALRRLGEDAFALFPAGGTTGELLTELLEAEGVPFRRIPIGASTRENLHVTERSTGRQLRFCMPGPTLREAEWKRLFEEVERLTPFPEYLVASGSLPPGVPVDFYAKLAGLVRGKGGRLVLDTFGQPLRLAAETGVFLIKPSLREFEEMTGEPGADESHLPKLAAELIARGSAELLVISLGAAGAFWATSSGAGRLAAPVVPVRSSVGAGDSMVAGVVAGLRRGLSAGEAVRLGVAAGAAAVMNPGTQLCRREDLDRLLGRVVEPAAPP